MAVTETDSQSSTRTNRIRIGLLLILVGLAVVTIYQLYFRKPQYEVQVFATSGGWGYSILTNGKTVIYQPTIPGLPGMVGFASQEQARRVGERVVEKAQQAEGLPTLTNDELRQLGVQIP